MPREKSVSVRSIAKQCGVSTATVSRGLNGSEHVSEKVRDLVLKAAKEEGYSIPEEATAIKEAPSLHAVKKIGVIMNSPGQDYYVDLYSRILRCLYPLGYQTISTGIDRDNDRLLSALAAFYDAGCEGIILISCPYSLIKSSLHPLVPHVWIDCSDEPKDCTDVCTVQSDQTAAGRLAALLLIGRGCKAPVVLTSSRDSVRSRQRCQGFFEEFKKAGIDLDEEERVKYLTLLKDVFPESREIVRYLIVQEFPFDSVFAISDWRALGAYTAVVRDLSRRVPEDIHIIGFDGISQVCRSVLNITSSSRIPHSLQKQPVRWYSL